MICLVAWKKVENRKVIKGFRLILASVDWDLIIEEKKYYQRV
jgi:hypothetical protein